MFQLAVFPSLFQIRCSDLCATSCRQEVRLIPIADPWVRKAQNTRLHVSTGASFVFVCWFLLDTAAANRNYSLRSFVSTFTALLRKYSSIARQFRSLLSDSCLACVSAEFYKMSVCPFAFRGNR